MQMWAHEVGHMCHGSAHEKAPWHQSNTEQIKIKWLACALFVFLRSKAETQLSEEVHERHKEPSLPVIKALLKKIKSASVSYPLVPLAVRVGWETITSAGLCQQEREKSVNTW